MYLLVTTRDAELLELLKRGSIEMEKDDPCMFTAQRLNIGYPRYTMYRYDHVATKGA
jgi:hypothetical protein